MHTSTTTLNKNDATKKIEAVGSQSVHKHYLLTTAVGSQNFFQKTDFPIFFQIKKQTKTRVSTFHMNSIPFSPRKLRNPYSLIINTSENICSFSAPKLEQQHREKLRNPLLFC